jgi:hypothetical protein
MKKLLVLALLALAFCFALPSQAQDETPGQQTVITVAVPTGGFSCGRANYPLYCIGVPANVGGTFWMDVYYKASNPNGFILFNGVLDLGQASVTAATYTLNSLGQPVTFHVAFQGLTNDGDNDTYTGTGDFTFSYVYHAGGGGRGNSSYYVQLMQTGTLTITYN